MHVSQNAVFPFQEEWPYRITLENLLDLEDERQLLGTEEDIAAELKQATR